MKHLFALRSRALAALAALLVLAPASAACESCRAALASDRGNFAGALNTSILFMLAMVFLVPLGFGFAVWNSYRSAASRERAGESFAPSGKRRW